jgi:hypothetical protein
MTVYSSPVFPVPSGVTSGGANSPKPRKPPRWPSCASSRAAGPDLLAEVAVLEEGSTERQLDEPRGCQAACLCRKVGADLEAIQAWIEEGRRRRANAGRPPSSGS